MPDPVVAVKHDPDISSAEMTGHWRSMEPNLSGDVHSTKMATPEGRAKAIDYQSTKYPFAGRHFSLRAGYFLSSALSLLFQPEADYDSVLSLGSGFSLLTYTIALTLKSKDSTRELYILDSDIDKILKARQEKLAELELEDLDGITFEQRVLNVEQAFKDGRSVAECFGSDIKKPIVILEGLSYFLTPDCLQWLFDGLQEAYPGAAIIWDYWPEDLLERSKFFSTVLEYFRKELPEDVQSLISNSMFSSLTARYRSEEFDLSDLEKLAVADESARVLNDEDTHIPARMGTLIPADGGTIRAKL